MAVFHAYTTPSLPDANNKPVLSITGVNKKVADGSENDAVNVPADASTA